MNITPTYYYCYLLYLLLTYLSTYHTNVLPAAVLLPAEPQPHYSHLERSDPMMPAAVAKQQPTPFMSPTSKYQQERVAELAPQ